MKSLTILTLFVIVCETLALIGPSFNIHNNRPHHDSYAPAQPSFGPRFKLEKEHEKQEPRKQKHREVGKKRFEDEDEDEDEVQHKTPKNNKLQSCTAELKFESCEDECKSNQNCPRSKICCRHSCGTSCVNPHHETEKKEHETSKESDTEHVKDKVHEKSEKKSEKKSGSKKVRLPTCPGGLKFDSCEKECKQNEHCPKTHVCCRFSCGTACVELPKENYDETKDLTEEEYDENREQIKYQYLDKIKKYQEHQDDEFKVELECPKLRSNVTCENVRELCNSDSDCSESQKCCRVRCSLRCVGPKGSKETRKNELEHDRHDKNEENGNRRNGRKQPNEQRKKNRGNSFFDEPHQRGFESLNMPVQNSYGMFNPFLMQNYQQQHIMPGAYQLNSNLF